MGKKLNVFVFELRKGVLVMYNGWEYIIFNVVVNNFLFVKEWGFERICFLDL